MKLLTKPLREQLLENGRRRGQDHHPVVKFFNPCGAATWLISELDADGDTLFGLCDMGFQCPELGGVWLSELAAIDKPFGLTIERDLYFTARAPLSVYADAALAAGRIVESGPELEAALARRRPAQRMNEEKQNAHRRNPGL